MTACPYEKNTHLENSATNLTIGELKRLSKTDFGKWAEKFRKEVTYAWDKFDIPVIGGKSADGIVADFKTLAEYDVTRIERPDELTGTMDCVVNPNVGGSCSQFFPTMMKTKDISGGSLDGASIYGYFSEKKYADQFKKLIYNAVKNDPFKAFSNTKSRLMDEARIFKVCFPIRPAGNFPPAVAKYLYLRFTDHVADQKSVTIYDPCAGWGGRILGAMSCCNERQVHYVGTDPNSDHWMSELGMTKYAYLADYFNGNVRAKFKNTYEIFQNGSEEISQNPNFQKYQGKVDLVFTSPPYFAAEGYSEEDTQSHMKFRTYEDWRDGYLKETLKTCVDYLKDGRWLIWNISDVVFSSQYLPLENETIKILEELGLEYRGKLKMAVATAPNGNKATADDVPTTKNFCRIDGSTRKFEPILMFWKPEAKQAQKTESSVPTFDKMIEKGWTL